MRRKLLLAVALAVLGAATAIGTVNASGSTGGLLDTSSSGVSIKIPGGQTLSTITQLPACSNGKDDDGDGLTDYPADPGCSSPTDNDEYNPPPATGGGGGGSGGTGGGSGGTGTGGGGTGGGTSSGTGGSTGGGTGGVTGGGTSGVTGPGNGSQNHQQKHHQSQPASPSAPYQSNGTPTPANPTYTLAQPGPAQIGVPSFIINQFSIPPFLLPIYQACGTQYGIPWEVLAGINRIETDFGTNMNVSSAGAVGWMQFLPSTWKRWGVDASGDGQKDPYNPIDAICAAARYLRASGGQQNIQRAVFAYNHASWYVDEVMLYARQYGSLPSGIVGSFTGLTQGDQFPVAAKARYADDLAARQAVKNAKSGQGANGNLASVVSGSPTRRGINIYSRDGAPVVAVNDGTIKRIGHNSKLGNFVVLEDKYGNRFTYAQLGRLSKAYPVPKHQKLTARDLSLSARGHHGAPGHAAGGAGGGHAGHAAGHASTGQGQAGKPAPTTHRSGPVNTENTRRRLYAYPQRSHNVDRAGLTGQLDHVLSQRVPGYRTVKSYLGGVMHFSSKTMTLQPLRKGSKVTAGTVLGRIGKVDTLAPHVNFAIRPAGRGAPSIDPKPILDGWKLLEDTASYRAAGQSPFKNPSITQTLLESKPDLQRQVLADSRLQIYPCGRNDVRTGQIDQRVLAAMEYLSESGFRLTITSLKCGSNSSAAAGPIQHTGGDSMDIADIDGLPVGGSRGSGSTTDALIRTVLKMQGVMRPDQVVSPENLPGPISFSLPEYSNAVHIGFQPLDSSGYQTPFLTAVEGRIDQGVDFTGVGPINAVGTARILKVGAPGWPEGGGVLYRLLDGPRAGQVVYVYEGIRSTVRPGQVVLAGQRVGTFIPGGSIEIGFADPAGAPLSHAIYHEGMVTPWGRKMASFLSSIGAPGKLDQQLTQLLRPSQWQRLVGRITATGTPKIPASPSRFAIPAGQNGQHGDHGSSGTSGRVASGPGY